MGGRFGKYGEHKRHERLRQGRLSKTQFFEKSRPAAYRSGKRLPPEGKPKMIPPDYLQDLTNCELCGHRCRVDRLAGETGVCRMTAPVVASATLHPAPPASYTVFMAGCNLKCLNCQNWTISQYPDNGFAQRGTIDPKELARECVDRLNTDSARRMGADRIFFSGGEATVHLPYVENVVYEARKIQPGTKVNFDTNGYMTGHSLERVLAFTTSITYDLKAYSDETSAALTGALASPSLRNAEHIGKYAKDKLWEFRILVIPQINEAEIRELAEFIANIDPSLPVCFLAFRPNFILENHPGADLKLMQKCVAIAKQSGLENASWAGYTGIYGKINGIENRVKDSYRSSGARLAGSYAYCGGCHTHPRMCSACSQNQNCKVKNYIPRRTS